MKTLVIGDIHGCFNELRILVEGINADPKNDRLIFTGDYIDRGPFSYEVLEYLSGLQSEYGKEHIILLRGNHEQMLIDCLSRGSRISWLGNGAGATFKSFQNRQKDIRDFMGLISSLPYYFMDEHFICVHGGLRPGKPLGMQCVNDLIWIRDEFIYSSYEFGKPVIFGHTPTQNINGRTNPIFMNGRIAIDTGCVFGGKLTALEIKQGVVSEIYQVGMNSEKLCKSA